MGKSIDYKNKIGVRARQLCRIFEVLVDETCLDTQQNPAEHLVLAMARAKFYFDELDSLLPGIALPLHDAVQLCRARPPNAWPMGAYELVGRSDLALLDLVANGMHNSSGIADEPHTKVKLTDGPFLNVSARAADIAHSSIIEVGNKTSRDEDGCQNRVYLLIL